MRECLQYMLFSSSSFQEVAPSISLYCCEMTVKAFYSILFYCIRMVTEALSGGDRDRGVTKDIN